MCQEFPSIVIILDTELLGEDLSQLEKNQLPMALGMVLPRPNHMILWCVRY